MRGIWIAALLLLAATGAQASIIEDTTGVHYQNDAGEGQDASDVCTDGFRPTLKSTSAAGMLVLVDDEVDHWLVQASEGGTERERTVHVGTDPLSHAVDGVLGASYLVSVSGAACEEVIASEEVPAGGEAQLTFLEEPGEDHVVQFELQQVTVLGQPLPDPGELTGPVPMNSHCAPWCMTYALSVS